MSILAILWALGPMGDSSMGGKIKRLACLGRESWGTLGKRRGAVLGDIKMSRGTVEACSGSRHWQQREKGMVDE